MDNDIERFRQMASMAQLGWWEADFTAGHYAQNTSAIYWDLKEIPYKLGNGYVRIIRNR